ncbi:MAG: exodeoxyribonuclease V subunit gamma, partial [Leptospiraceae bacterium]|nr:exodeoxyribonuclease V subunit gamma [Leptospiraceae bacterium]
VRNGIFRFVSGVWNPEVLLNDLAGTLLFKQLLEKEKGKLSEKAIWKISEELFSQREKSIQSMKSISRSHPYFHLFEKFETLKKEKKTRSEYLQSIFFQENFSIPEPLAQNIYKKTIFCYALFETDMLTIRILEKISEFVSIHFFMTEYPIFSDKEEKIHGEYSSTSIYNYLSKQKNYTKKSENTIPVVRFAKSIEVRREVEFVGRNILRKISDNKDKDLKLYHFKLILPKLDLYIQSVREVFREMGISVSFTFDNSLNLTPYYSAVFSIINFLKTDFEAEAFRNIFCNPCFNPKLSGSSVQFQPDYWSECISLASIVKYADSFHRETRGISTEDFYTWDRGWRILTKKIIGIEEEGYSLSDENEKKEAMKFIQISSSLIYDLLYLREGLHSLKERTEFLRSILSVYLTSTIAGEDSANRNNKNAENSVFRILDEISECEEKIGTLGDISISLFLEIVKDRILNLSRGEAGVLKKGVVAGTVRDTSDIVFRYIYALGMDESNFNPDTGRSFEDEVSRHELQKDKAILNKMYFYKIFQHSPKEILFSYVCLDTIRDSPTYPYLELEDFKKNNFPKSNWENIPLYGHSEVLQNESLILLEKEAAKFTELKQSELNSKYVKFASFGFKGENEKEKFLQNEIQSLSISNDLKLSIENYFLRDRFLAISNFESKKIYSPLTDFIKYIECPQKYFFEKSLALDEETEYTQEGYEVGGLTRNIILKRLIKEFLINSDKNFDSIFSKSFISTLIEKGELSSGIFGAVELERFRKYFDEFLVSVKDSILSQYSVITDLKFQDRFLKQSEYSYIIRPPVFFGENIFQGPEMLFYSKDRTLLVTLETSPKKKSGKPYLKQKLKSIFYTQSI